MLHSEPAPTEPAQRGAEPAPFDLATIDDPGLPPVPAELATAWTDETDTETINGVLGLTLSGS
ncbi:hypothetical protein ABZ904_32455 [Streptomyces sp. NPDC046900]|uniref:hypothetical protein n=1 Tax=Streptomyces sp. NPDC046900 TaxID=3155473 RepID=UPI0033BFD6EB